jgi:hypothetical protein
MTRHLPEIVHDWTWNRFKTTDCGSFVGDLKDLAEIAHRCNAHEDMLAALEALAAIVNEPTTKFPANRVVAAGAAYAAAIAAIAKARGE